MEFATGNLAIWENKNHYRIEKSLMHFERKSPITSFLPFFPHHQDQGFVNTIPHLVTTQV